jgi:hypothetical protein
MPRLDTAAAESLIREWYTMPSETDIEDLVKIILNVDSKARSETAKECAGIASMCSQTRGVANAIRRVFSLQAGDTEGRKS